MKKIFTLFALLALVANMGWAENRTIYLNTAGSGWASNSNFWVHTWGGNSTQQLKMSAVSGESNLFSVEINDDQTKIIFVPQSTIGQWNGQSSNIDLDGTKNCYNYKDSKWETYEPLPEGAVGGDLLAVLKGEKVMFYGGEEIGWNQSTFNVYPESGGAAVSSGEMTGSYTFGTTSTTTFEFAALCAAPNVTYQWGHWQSGLKLAATAGCAMIVRNSGKTNEEYESKTTSGSNALYKVTRSCTTTATTTVGATATVGGSLSYEITSAAGKSVLKKDNSFKTYLYDGTNYKEVTPSDNAIDVSELAEGEGYKVLTVLYDGSIYVVAKTDEFSVVAAGSTSHTISYTTAGKWSYGEGKPTVKDEGETVEFTVTPNAGYTVSVSSEQVTLNKSENTYSFTMPAENVTINVSATAQYFGITYPATATNYTLSGHSETAATDEEVNFTVTPADGYKVTVTSEQATISKNANNYSFTMPAKAVTVAIEATEIPMTTLYFWNKDSWSNVYVHMWYGNATATSWPGTQLTTKEYQSDGHSIYKVTFEEGDYGQIIFNNNNGQQTGDLTVASNNGKCYYGKNGGWNDLPEENWKVTISAENGSVESSKYVGATQKTVTATASDGYVFDKWEVTGGVTLVDGNTATATVTANAEGTLKAIFKADASKFSVNFSAVGGTVTAKVAGTAISNGAKFAIGTPVNVEFTATATNSGDTFYGWYDKDNNKVSEENPYTVGNVNANYVIKAVYAGKYYLKHDWNQAGWGVKEMTFDPATSLFYLYDYYGNNGFNYGNTESVSGWNGGASSNTLVGSPAAKDWCLITTPGDGNITVTKVTESHNLAVNGENATLSIKVNGADATTALHMQPATFAATPADGYGFDGWYSDDAFTQLVTTDASYPVTVTADVTLYAKTTAETQYTITIANDVNSETSTTNVGATAKALEAPAIALYTFTNWTVEGDAVIADADAANTTITATGAATVTAHYKLNQYFIKHKNWNEAGNDWDWKEATYIEGNTISLWAQYNGSGCNWNTAASSTGATWVENPTKVGDPQSGDCCKFTLDPVAGTITITKIDDTPADPLETRYYLYGSFEGWDVDNAICFMKQNESDNIAYATMHVDATDDVEFKIYKNGTCEWKYYGNEGTIDAATTFDTWWSMTTDKGNCTIEPLVAGDYVFALNLDDKRIKVEYPKTAISINTTYQYATYYGPIALKVPDGVTASYVSGVSGDQLTMVDIDVIPAETGVILYAANGGDFEFAPTITTDDYSADNLLKGTLTATVINNDLTHYILSATSAENVGLYFPKGTGNNNGVGAFTNGAGKAYLEIPAATPVSARAFLFGKHDVSTSLEQTMEQSETGKYILNGQLVIVRDGKMYTAQGQLVK